MEYCNGGYNGMVYHHSQQHNHEFRYKAGMMKVGYNNNYNNVYGHNQHISWNGMPPHHPSHPHPSPHPPAPGPAPVPPPSSSSSSHPSHHHHSHHHHHHHHPQYGNRNISATCHYDSYKGGMVQNCFQSSYSGNFESPYESTATGVPTTPAYRSRFAGGYQMCDTQQCFPNGDTSRADYMSPLNGHNSSSGSAGGIPSRCLDPVLSSNSNISVPSDPRNSHQPPPPSSSSSFIHDSITHHSHMRMPPHSNHRVYDSQHPKAGRPFESGQHQQQQHQHQHHQHSPSSWYGNPPSHNNSSETINESNHHYYQYHHAINHSNYNEYPHHHINTNGNHQYTAGAPNGQLMKEDKPPKMHRDRSLSKLVAMNRRLETQMNESERIEQQQQQQQQQPLHHEPFDNFDYYTDYSETTPDSITSSSQYTNNDCMMNSSDTDNNNNVNGATNNSQKSNCKETNNQQATSESDWQQTSISTPQTTATTPTPTTSLSSPPPAIITTTTTIATSLLATDTIRTDTQTNGLNSSEPSVPIDGNLIKKNDLPSVNTTIKSPAKHNTNKKIVKSKKVNNMTKEHSVEKRRKRKEKKSNTGFSEIRELKTDTIPLPGFQQAFGSTEIGRFSEIFFNVSGSPIEIGIFESEADTLSPQPWEMGDSLEGPHFSMQANNTPLSYAESLGSTDSPTASNNSYFSDLRASEF